MTPTIAAAVFLAGLGVVACVVVIQWGQWRRGPGSTAAVVARAVVPGSTCGAVLSAIAEEVDKEFGHAGLAAVGNTHLVLVLPYGNIKAPNGSIRGGERMNGLYEVERFLGVWPKRRVCYVRVLVDDKGAPRPEWEWALAHELVEHALPDALFGHPNRDADWDAAGFDRPQTALGERLYRLKLRINRRAKEMAEAR